jgi:hypothetical protein
LGITQLDEVVAGDVVTPARRPAIHRRSGPRRATADHSNAAAPPRLVAEPVGYIVHTGIARSTSPATQACSGDARLPEITSLSPIWGWGLTLGDRHLDPERARPPPTGSRHGADPLGHVHTDHTAALGMDDNPIAAFTAALAEPTSDRLTVLRPGETMMTGDVRSLTAPSADAAAAPAWASRRPIRHPQREHRQHDEQRDDQRETVKP